MAKSKKSKILAMALCASVMTGIYAAPVMASVEEDVNTLNNKTQNINASDTKDGETRFDGKVTADKFGTWNDAFYVEENGTIKGNSLIIGKNGDNAVFKVDRNGAVKAANGAFYVDKGGNVTTKGTLSGTGLVAEGADGGLYVQDIGGETMIFAGPKGESSTLRIDPTNGNFMTKGTMSVADENWNAVTQIQGSGENIGDIAVGIQYDGEGNITGQNIVLDASTGDIIAKGTLSGTGLAAEGADGGLYVQDIGGETMIFAGPKGESSTLRIDPTNGNFMTKGTMSVADENWNAVTQIQGSGENIGDIAVGIQYDGEGNITGQNIVLDASTGDIIAKGTLSGTGLAAEGADGGLYVQDIGGETMIFAGPKGESSTLRIDPTNGNFMTKGTMSVADENWNAVTQIQGSGENIGDIAVGIKADGTQMIHLDASTGSITAADFNGVKLATNGDQVLVGGYDISQMDETLGTVGGDVSQLRTDVNDLRLDVGGLRTDVRILRDDVGGLRTDVNTINSNLEALTDRVQNVEDKTQGISYDKDTGTTTIDGNLDVKGDTETGAGGNENVKGDITAEGDVNGTNGNFDKVTTGEISADKGNIGNSNFDENGITVGAAGGQHTTITDTTVDATNGYFDNLQADKADIGGVGLEGGTVTADKVVTGNTTLDNEGLNVGGQTSVTADGVNVGGNGGTTVSKDGVSIADKTIISDHDVVINEGTADRVSLSETADRVGNLEQGVSELNNRVGELEDRIDKVGAMAAAIANLRTMGYDPAAPTEVAVGIGQYRDETGATLGLFHYPNRDFMLSLSVSTSGDEVMGGIGATWKFGRKSPEKVAEIKKAQAEADARRAEEAKLAKAEEMKQAAKEAKIKAQQERHAKLAAERAAQAEAAK